MFYLIREKNCIVGSVLCVGGLHMAYVQIFFVVVEIEPGP
jgi:hypothetical protein